MKKWLPLLIALGVYVYLRNRQESSPEIDTPAEPGLQGEKDKSLPIFAKLADTIGQLGATINAGLTLDPSTLRDFFGTSGYSGSGSVIEFRATPGPSSTPIYTVSVDAIRQVFNVPNVPIWDVIRDPKNP